MPQLFPGFVYIYFIVFLLIYFTGCWLGCGDGCLMQRHYIVKMIGNVSDWLSYAGGALKKVTD